jgi:hypothetical protein
MFEKNKGICPLSNFEYFKHAKKYLFLSSFEHVNFATTRKYSKKNMTIQIIMFPLWYFKHTKMQF